MRANDMKRAVLIIKDPEVIHLLSSFIKSEILRLLGMRPMTETQLSKVLRLTKAAVGYHLHSMKDVGLIQIDIERIGNLDLKPLLPQDRREDVHALLRLMPIPSTPYHQC